MYALAAASQQPLAAASITSPHQQQSLYDLSRYRQYNLAQQFLSQQQGAVTKLLGKDYVRTYCSFIFFKAEFMLYLYIIGLQYLFRYSYLYIHSFIYFSVVVAVYAILLFCLDF